jgi:uncharacterized protein with HEPN domain
MNKQEDTMELSQLLQFIDDNAGKTDPADLSILTERIKANQLEKALIWAEIMVIGEGSNAHRILNEVRSFVLPKL